MNLRKFLRTLAVVAVATAAQFASSLTWAQAFPAKPIRIVVPTGPGSSPDLLARSFGEKLSESLGQPVVIDNRPGANGVIATDIVAKSPADGYTLLMAYDSHATNPSLQTLPYNTAQDFAPISLVAKIPLVLTVGSNSQATSIQQMLGLAKASAGQFNFASVGRGSSSHLAGELLKTMTGVPMTHIPYKDNGGVVTDLVGGRVQMTMLSLVSMLPMIKDGRVRALAVSVPTRSAALPQVPTMMEAGIAGFDYAPWIGLIAPAKTPRDVIAKLNAEMVRIAALSDVQKRYAEQLLLTTSTPDKFESLIKSDIERWSRIPMGQ